MATSITGRLFSGTAAALLETPFTAVGGAIVGYVYGKLADLSPRELAKAWAIWNVAERALTTLAKALLDDVPTLRNFVVVAISTASTAIGISELQKRNLIGYKMSVVLIAINALEIVNFLLDPSKNEDEDKSSQASGEAVKV